MGRTHSIRDNMKARLYRRDPVFSFEFFPPKDEAGEKTLARSLDELAPLSPTFISVTCGAGGSTRGRTGAIVGDLQRKYDFGVMAHVVGCGSSKAQLAELVRSYADAGIDNFLALRGDPPRNAEEPFEHPADEPAHADEVVRIVRENAATASVGVAGYPEGHPTAANLEEDLRHLAGKVAAGADFVVTQIVFDNDAYFDFARRARKAGVAVPILPGVMPITNAGQIERFRELCGGRMRIPEPLLAGIERFADMPDRAERVRELGVAYSAAQCADLLRRGAPGIHFYTLNQSRACHAIYQALRAAGWTDAPAGIVG